MLNARLNRRPLTRAVRLTIAAALAALTVPIAAIAQNQFSTFSGTVTDETNRYLPDTRLVLIRTNSASTAKYEVKSDATGHFEFVGLQAGDYKLLVDQRGFTPLADLVTISGADVTRRITLHLASLEESITMTTMPGPPDANREQRQQLARLKAQAMRQKVEAACAAGPTPGDVGGNIAVPFKLVDVKPVYPEQLKTDGIGGLVTLDAVIATDGTVRDVKTIAAESPDLERAAIDAVRQWEFSTTYLNCTPVEVRMKVTAKFVADR